MLLLEFQGAGENSKEPVVFVVAVAVLASRYLALQL